MRLRRKLYLAFFLSAALPTAMVAALHLVTYLRETDAVEAAHAQGLAGVTAVAIEGLVQDAARDTRAFFVAGAPREEPRKLSRRLAEFTYAYPHFRALLWVSPQGAVLASSDPAHVGQALVALYGELADEFSRVAQDQAGMLLVSDFDDAVPGVRPALDAGRVERTALMLQFLLRVDDERGDIAGVLVAVITNEAIAAALEDLRRAGQGVRSVELLNRDGTVVLSSDPRTALLQPHPLADRIARESRSSAGAPVHFHDESDGGKRHVTVRELSGIGPQRAAAWRLVVIQSEDTALALIRLALLQTLAVLVAILGGAWFGGLRIASSIVRPAEALAAAAKRLGAGDLAVRAAAVAGNDEHGDLARAFNAMAEALAQDRAALDQANQTLERRVQERTAELSRTTDALRESEERNSAVIRSALDAIVVNDGDGHIVEFNPAAERTFGWRREEAIGRDLAELLIPDSYGGHWRRRFRESLARGIPDFQDQRVEASALHADGHEFPIELTVQRLERERDVYFVAFVRDISARKQAEEAQRASEARLRQLVGTSPAIIWSCRPDRGYAATFISDNVRAQLGYEPEEFVRDSAFWANHIHPEDRERVSAGLAPLVERGRIEHEYRFRHKDGSWRWMHDKATVLRNADGNPSQIVGCWIDITARKQAQESLQEALRAKTEFMNNVTHELRTPLNSIIGFAELLKDEVPGPLNAKQAEFAADIWDSGLHLLKLVEAIIAMSRLDASRYSLEAESIEIGAALAECAAARRQAAAARGLTIALQVAPDAGSVRLDPRALRRVLDALLDNAVEFNREGGAITLRARRADGTLEIAVADTGIGIAQSDLPRLFKPFVQLDAGKARRHGGVGLGLTLTRRLVELHGGTIEVQSEPGKGSTFTLHFPLRENS